MFHGKVRRARTLHRSAFILVSQSAVFGLLGKLPVIFEIHIQPTGFWPWHRLLSADASDLPPSPAPRQYSEPHPYRQEWHCANGVDLERFIAPRPDAARRRRTGLLMYTRHLMKSGCRFVFSARNLFHNFVCVGGH
jgi:hypothetical protein